jgi:AraC-like DNA-binding protein
MTSKKPERADISTLEEMARAAKKISEPDDFLRGRSGNAPLSLPGNILCFVHRREKIMQPTESRAGTQHHRYVLIVALRGSGHVCIDAENSILRPGQALLVFPFQFHSYLSLDEDVEWVFVTFETADDTSLKRLRSTPPRHLGETELILVRELFDLWVSDRPGGLIQLHLATLLGRLNEKKSLSNLSGGGATIEQGNSELLSRINAYVMERMDQPLSIKRLALFLGTSTSHLRRRFSHATGLSLGRHMRNLRLQRACSLLHNSQRSISEVAACCGFDSVYAFSRSFKRTWRVSPLAYRKGQRG